MEKKFCSRPLDMPPDTAEIQYDEEDFFFWNMINADNQDNVLKTKMKGLLVMDKTFNQKMYEAELFRALNPLSGTRDSDFEETDPTFELPGLKMNFFILFLFLNNKILFFLKQPHI